MGTFEVGQATRFVLAVDDSRADLRMIEESLEPLDLSIREATDGYGALAGLYEQEFAVALIDLRMPGIDGFELAAEIRRHPRASALPILFITASQLTRTEVRRAYALAAVDVVQKPFMAEVLRAKVSVFVELERRQRGAELRRELEDLVLATAHGAQEPVRIVNHLVRELHRNLTSDGHRDLLELTENLWGQALRAHRFVDGLLQISRMRLDPEGARDVEPADVIDAALLQVDADLAEVGGSLEVAGIPRVRAHPLQLRLLFRELFDNCIRFRGRSPLRIRVSGVRIPDEVLISVEDNGIGIPSDRAHRVFELLRPLRGGPCFQLGMGIGLALARRVVHLNAGCIWCEPSKEGGARICFTLPTASDARDEPASA